jgi:uncharacterized membrane protein
MLTEIMFQITLILATFLTTLVTGFVLIFAIVVMPGIGRLKNHEFLRAFQVIDRTIQNNQPLFVLIWIGSALALLVATVLGIGQLQGLGRILMILAAMSYIVGTQLPTIVINIPLNNRLQTVNIDALNETSQRAERRRFESRWNRWNAIRTAFASLSSALLITLLWLM